MLHWHLFQCLLILLIGHATTTLVQEVQLGEVATLLCPSSDPSHRFQFWKTNEDVIVGPKNLVDHQKYRYDVLTGTLTIKGVSSHENGIFTCVCKKLGSNSSEPVSDPMYRSKSIELIVKRNWEVVYETDHVTNIFRGIIVVSVLVILTALGYIIYTTKKTNTPRFRVLLDDEAVEEELLNRNPSPYKPTVVSTSGLETSGVDTDFPKEFTISVHSPPDGR